MIDPVTVQASLERVRADIADAGGDPDAIAVLAVTKGFGPDAPRAALAAGLTTLGENYAQELADKAAALAADRAARPAQWHFIGRLQSNKVRQVADLVDCWQSVDRASLVDEIAKRAPGARVMIQVNATSEGQKGGCAVTDTQSLVARAGEAGLEVTGLMTVGVADDDVATARAFDTVRALVDDLGLSEASMGMSADLALAVKAGTTMVRTGTALFGPRPRRDSPAVRD